MAYCGNRMYFKADASSKNVFDFNMDLDLKFTQHRSHDFRQKYLQSFERYRQPVLPNFDCHLYDIVEFIDKHPYLIENGQPLCEALVGVDRKHVARNANDYFGSDHKFKEVNGVITSYNVAELFLLGCHARQKLLLYRKTKDPSLKNGWMSWLRCQRQKRSMVYNEKFAISDGRCIEWSHKFAKQFSKKYTIKTLVWREGLYNNADTYTYDVMTEYSASQTYVIQKIYS